ncbi:MAG: thioesterase family protein [Sphingobacteriales bacterium]|jgi:acyl-CoA thioesterase FadM|nr:MAG: thioesterase family protein [Sphingobacteriales bacterium]
MTRIDIEIPKKILYTSKFTIEQEDINHAKHMGNERILIKANQIRTNFYAHLQLADVDWEKGEGTILANHAIKYVSEGFLGDTVECQVGVQALTECSFDLVFHFIKNNTKTLAIVRSGCVYFNYHEKRIKELPNSFIEAFQL